MSKQNHDSWVTLIEVNNPVQADLIRSILEGSGIESYVPQESFGITYGGVLGIKIRVHPEDAERAKEVLNNEGKYHTDL